MRGFLAFVYQLRLFKLNEERKRNWRMKEARKLYKKLARNIDVSATNAAANELIERTNLPVVVVRMSNWNEVIDYLEPDGVFTIVDCPIDTPLIATLQIFAAAEFRNFGFQTSFRNCVTARYPSAPGDFAEGFRPMSDAVLSHYREIRTSVARKYERVLTGSGQYFVLPKHKSAAADFVVDLPESVYDEYVDVAAADNWEMVDRVRSNDRVVIRCSLSRPAHVRFRIVMACHARSILRFQSVSY